MRVHRIHMLLPLLLLVCAAAGAAEPAGKMIFAGADTRATDAQGAARSLERGDPVFAGDLISTGPARAQLRFSDGQMLSLRPHTRFRIDQYRYAGAPDGTERGFFSLLAGGIRALTGAIGRERREAYRVNTEHAAIGIRGTGYEARLCAGDCAPGEGGRGDGLYLRVSAGIVTLTNAAGTLEVAAGLSAFVASFDTLPRLEVPDAAPDTSGQIPQLRPEDPLRHDVLEQLEPVSPGIESHPHPQ